MGTTGAPLSLLSFNFYLFEIKNLMQCLLDRKLVDELRLRFSWTEVEAENMVHLWWSGGRDGFLGRRDKKVFSKKKKIVLKKKMKKWL